MEVKDFLNTIQKTASYLIDSIDGEKEALEINYDTLEFSLLVNYKTVIRLFEKGLPVYLVHPGMGELFTTKRNEVDEHTGPFATSRHLWQDMELIAV